jgi:hypothetical protein
VYFDYFRLIIKVGCDIWGKNNKLTMELIMLEELTSGCTVQTEAVLVSTLVPSDDI